MQRAIGALLDGQPVPDDVRASLTEDERAEAARLAATAALARAALHAPTPPPEAEAASLRRAQELVARQPDVSPPTPPTDNEPVPPPQQQQPGARGWLARWRRRRNS